MAWEGTGKGKDIPDNKKLNEQSQQRMSKCQSEKRIGKGDVLFLYSAQSP